MERHQPQNQPQNQPQWWQGLGRDFWLALPVLAMLFWFGCSWMTVQVLSRPYGTKDKLEADTQLEVQVSANVAMIMALINRAEGLTQVEVQTSDSTLRKLEFEFPITEPNQLEATIAQELGLSRADVRRLVRYQIMD